MSLARALTLPTRRPVLVLALIAAATALAASQIVDLRTGRPALRVDPSVDRLLPDDDDARAFCDRVREEFGSDDALVIAIVTEDVLTAENLRLVRRATELLEGMEEVDYVTSLANVPNVRSVGDEISVRPFLEPVPEDAREVERLRREVLRNPVYAGNLVSRDARSTALRVYLAELPEQELIAREVDRKLAASVRRLAPDAEVWVTGPPHIRASTARFLLADLSRIIPLAFGVMAIVAFASFRTLRGVLLPIATILVALVWTFGVVAWLGVPLNLVTVSVPPLILTIGFAYAVHVISDYHHALREDPQVVEAKGGVVPWALRRVALPVSLTGLTTAVGFGSLGLSAFGAVREFAGISVIGVSCAVLVALSLVPAILALLPLERAAGGGPLQREGALERRLEGLGRFDVERRTLVLAAGAALFLLAVVGTSQIRVKTELITNFKRDSDVRRHFEAINRELEGATPVSVVFESDLADAFLEPENLREIAAFQRWIAEQPEVGGSTSFADHVALLNRAFHGDRDRYLAIPESAELTRQLLLFGWSDEFERFVDGSYQLANVSVRTTAADSREMAGLVSRIEERLAQLPSHLRARVTGDTVLLTKAIDDVAQGQVRSLSVAALFIYGILVAMFTSFRVGLFALIPNVLPVLLYFAALGFTGISLNPTTGLTACIVLGIAVDDTIHFLARFNGEARRLADERGGAISALRLVGRPVTVTTVGLCLGFLLLTTSNLNNQVQFGSLAALTLGLAWLIDVTFTPAICSGVRIVTLWDLVRLDLGPDPHQAIPVFRGLRNHQAKMAALVTGLRRIPAGSSVFRAGDTGEELLAVIEGEMRVSLDIGGRRIELDRPRRGSVVGEVALFHGKRTADVDAVTDVRVLSLTKRNLERLCTRYPRIGARIYRNLTEILAERVANTTDKLT